MAACSDCGKDFPLQNDGSNSCHMCRSLADLQSPVEKQAQQKKPQCKSCGLVWPNLQDPVCQACFMHWAREGSLPEVLQFDLAVRSHMQGVFKAPHALTTVTSSLVSRASELQKEASGPRFGAHVRTTGTGSKVDSISKEKLGKMRENYHKADLGRIKFMVTVWRKISSGKMIHQSDFNNQKAFKLDMSARIALDTILEEIQSSHARSHPNAMKLNWSNITLFAQGSTLAQYFCLEKEDLFNETVQGVWAIFLKQCYPSAAAMKDNRIEIRFVYKYEDVFFDEFEDYNSVMPTSKRAKMVSQALPPGRSGVSAALSRKRASAAEFRHPAATSHGKSVMPSSVTPSIRLRSIYAPKAVPDPQSNFTRNPPLVEITFTAIEAKCEDDSTVRWFPKFNNEPKKMQVATDWQEKEEKKDYFTGGLLGKGGSKVAIYARFDDKEYALVQMQTGYDNGVNSDYLLAELKVLSTCHHFKQIFECEANFVDLQLPVFHVQQQGVFLGTLISGDLGPLRYDAFLASPLLRCSKVDPPVYKFTGGVDIPEPKSSDHMEMAIHSFVHFSHIYSKGNIIFTDMQGLLNDHGDMTLFDPQWHTTNLIKKAYFDTGPSSIKRVLEAHLEHCSKNWICQRLHFLTETEQAVQEN